MGKYMRKGKRVGEVAVEVTHASMGVRTRARTLALEQAISASTKLEGAPRLEAPPRIDYCYLELRSRKLEKVSRFMSRGGGGGNGLNSEKLSVGKSHTHSASATTVEAYRAKASDNAGSKFSYCQNNYEASHCSGSASGRESLNVGVLRDAPLALEMGVVSVGKVVLRSTSLSSHRLKIRKSFDLSDGSKLVALPLQVDAETDASGGAAMDLGFEMEASFGDNTMDYECSSAHENQSISVRDLREGTPTSNFSHMEVAMEAPGSTSRVRANQSFTMAARRSASEGLVVPASHEIEEFFSHAEIQQVQRRLSERYNFDFDNDVPLEGRFEWCNLHQL